MIAPADVKAYSFTIPSGSNYALDNVILRLGSYDTVADVPLVQIRDNSNPTNPASGNVLATLTNPTPNDGSVANFTFTPSSVFTFIENATYFLYVTATGGSFSWEAGLPGDAPAGIATSNGYLLSSDGGANFNSSTTLNSLQINATATATSTPEPASMIGLIAVGVGLFATKKGKQDHN